MRDVFNGMCMFHVGKSNVRKIEKMGKLGN
jgi:hypothetical protein